MREHRSILATMVPPGSHAVELGVARGLFSAELLSVSPNIAHLWSIDRWSDHHDDAEYREASWRLSAFGARSTVLRESFADAVLHFQDQSFDLVYIDGYAHTGQESGQTLEDWWPKAKPGAIFGGHDYCHAWLATLQTVDAFARAHDRKIEILSGDQFPSWYVRR